MYPKKPNISIVNISFADFILNYLSYINALSIYKSIRSLLIYRRTYRNYINVMMNILKRKYPIEAIMRNGTHTMLHNRMEAQIHGGRHKNGGHNERIEYDTDNNIVRLSALPFDHSTITIYGAITNGDIMNIFVNDIYHDLPVKDKAVIDIGANIADSALYFALRGATRIICLEPFPKNYELAEKNIKLNNFSNTISLILAGCSNKREKINIDPTYQSGILSKLEDFRVGIEVPLLTLKDILSDYNLPCDGSLILKMDCEGCEYETILSADDNTLQEFSHMMIEYHYGYKNLKEKLERSGFRISVTRPRIQWSCSELLGKKFNLAVGNIFAERV